MAKDNQKEVKKRVTPTNLRPAAQELLKEISKYEGIDGKLPSEQLSDIVENHARDKYGAESVIVYRGKDGVRTNSSSTESDEFSLDKILHDEQKQLALDYTRARIEQMKRGFGSKDEVAKTNGNSSQSLIQDRIAQMMDLNMMNMMMQNMNGNKGSNEEVNALKEEIRRMKDELNFRKEQETNKLIQEQARRYEEERNRLLAEFKTDKGISARELIEMNNQTNSRIEQLRMKGEEERQKRLEERYENTLKQLTSQLRQANAGQDNISELSESIKKVKELGELLGVSKNEKPPKDKTELLLGVVQNGVEALSKAYATHEIAKANNPRPVQAQRVHPNTIRMPENENGAAFEDDFEQPMQSEPVQGEQEYVDDIQRNIVEKLNKVEVPQVLGEQDIQVKFR